MARQNDRSMRFLLVGNGPYENRGCEAIVRGTVEILSRKHPEAKFVLSSFGDTTHANALSEKDPRIEHRLTEVKGNHLADPKWWMYRVVLRPFPAITYRYRYNVQYESLKDAVCALSIGGDNYTLDYSGMPLHLLHLDEALLSLKKPVVLWGASIGPFSQDPQAERTMSEHLKRLSLILVRESETLAYLDSIGISDNVRVVADPAFLMQPREPILSDDLLKFIGEKPIGLNLSPLAGRYTDDKDSWQSLVGKCISTLAELGPYPVLLIPHVFQAGNDDYAFMLSAVRDFIGTTDRLKILPPTLSAAEYKWVISRLRAFAGARTHATIASLSTCVPTISIGYSMKARGINKDVFGNLKWLLPVGELSADTLLSKVAETISHEDDIRRHLTNVNPGVKDMALSAAGYLSEVLPVASGGDSY